MRFSEFHVGQILEAGPVQVTQPEILAFATAFDPQWFHTDLQAVDDGPYGGLIASGWHTCSMAMRLMADAILAGSESFGSPGLSYLRWPAPVRPGDTLRLRADVLGVRRSAKRPDLGVLEWRWRMLNQADVEVLDMQATSLFDLKR